MKRKQLWLFLAKLVPLTLALGYIWFSGLQLRYPDLIEPVAAPIMKLCGVTRWWLNLVLEHFTSIVPYLALVVSTPGLVKNWKRVSIALVGGTAAIIFGHILMSIAVYHIMDLFAGLKTSYILIIPVYLINDTLPLILWLLFFPRLLGELFDFTRSKPDRPHA